MNKKKNRSQLQALLITLFVGMIVLSALGCGSGSGPELAEKPAVTQGSIDSAATTTPTENPVFTVGDTVAYDDMLITFVGITESKGSSFNTPTDGNVFVLSEFEIENTGDTEISVSSMLSFEAYCDDYACSYSLGALMEKGNKNQLDGTAAPGKKIKGVVGYEIPTDWQKLEINFTEDMLFGQAVTFVVTHN